MAQYPPTKKPTHVKVEVDIKPGSASPPQKAAWRRFWQKLTSEAKREAKDSI